MMDVAEGIFDGPHATPKKVEEGPYFLSISSLQGGRLDLTPSARISETDYPRWTRRVTPAAGDLVFSYETRIGEAALIPAGLRCCLGRRMALVRPDRQKVIPEFLLYHFLSPDFQEVLRSRTVPGSTVPRILLTEFPDFPMRLPPLKEQREIVWILSALDDKIDLNRQMNRTLEAMAQAIFRSWFVDFDPVVAKSEGREPFGMDADTAALFPDRFVESELGPIPEGWEVKPINDAFEVNPRRRLSKGAEAPYLEMSNVPEQGAIPSVWVRRPFGSGTKFQNGDTLLARITPCLDNGKTAFVNFLDPDEVGWGSTEYVVFRPRPPLPPSMAYFLSRAPELRGFAIANLTGSSGRQRIPTSAWEHFLFPWPPAAIAARFGDVADRCLDLMLANVRESQTLASLRDLLLPKLLSGEIRVPEAEEIVEDVA